MPQSDIEFIRKMLDEEESRRDLEESNNFQKSIDNPNTSDKKREYDFFDKNAIDIKRGVIEAAPSNLTSSEKDEMNSGIQREMEASAKVFHKADPYIKDDIPFILDSLGEVEARKFVEEELELQRKERELDSKRYNYDENAFRVAKEKMRIAKGVLEQQIQSAIKLGKINEDYYREYKRSKEDTSKAAFVVDSSLKNIPILDSAEPTKEEPKKVINDEIKPVTSNNLNELSDEELIKKARAAAKRYLDKNLSIYDRIDMITHDNTSEVNKEIKFNQGLEEAFNNIDRGIKPSITPQKKKPTPVITPSITLETINPDVHSHKEIFEKIEKIHEINQRYEKQIYYLPNDKFSKSLKKEMYKEIKSNIKLLNNFYNLEETYNRVLINVKRLKTYEDMQPSSFISKMVINKKIRQYAREINRLCGRNNEYLPSELLDEINNTVGRIDKNKEIKIVSKKKVSVPNKKELISKALLAGVLALSIFTTTHLVNDKTPTPIEEPQYEYGVNEYINETNSSFVNDNVVTIDDIPHPYNQVSDDDIPLPEDIDNRPEKTQPEYFFQDTSNVQVEPESNPINEMMKIGKQIAQNNGISEDVIYNLYNRSNKALDNAIDFFAHDKETEKTASKNL